jgi:hypothetical protein
MVALLIICTGLTCVCGCVVPRSGFLPRDPNSLIDTAALVAQSRSILQVLRGAGGDNAELLRERLGNADYYIGVEAHESSSSNESGDFKIFQTFQPQEAGLNQSEKNASFPYPLDLHPGMRLGMLAAVIALIVGLEASLRSSINNNGLADAGDDTYSHVLWTALPTLVLTVFALHFASADFMTRVLAPYAALTRGASFNNSVGLDYVDKYPIVVLFRAVISQNMFVATATAALLTSSLFAIFTAAILSAVTFPATGTLQLVNRDFFSRSTSLPDASVCGQCQNGIASASLILNTNGDYPPFTYEDLNLPTLAAHNGTDNVTVADDMSVAVVVPALRPTMTCRVFKQGEVTANLTVAYSIGNRMNPLRIDLPGEPKGSGEENGSTFIFATAGSTPDTKVAQDAFFGDAEFKPIKLANGAIIAHWVYAWGQLKDANTNKTTVISISGMSCNETIDQVNVQASLFGSSLAILPSNPPVVDESTVQHDVVPVPQGPGNFYRQLTGATTKGLFDPFFMSLLDSPFTVPVDSIGNSSPDVVQRVADAIVRAHKVIRTQVLSEWNRRATSGTSSANGSSILDNAAGALFTGTLTSQDPQSPVLRAQRRVVQDMVATRILQGLLAATLVLSLVSWAAMPKTNLLPARPPCSIAARAALLADGNLFGFLGRGAEWQNKPNGLRAAFMDGLHVTMRFGLSWQAPTRRRREETLAAWGMTGSHQPDESFGIRAMRTGGWGGGENVGLGLQARVGFNSRKHVRDAGYKT